MKYDKSNADKISGIFVTLEGLMNKYSRVTALIVAAIILTLKTPSYSQENQTNSTVSMPELKWMYGTVSQVSFVKGFILVITDQGYLTVTVPDNTTIMLGPKKASLDEIKTEDMVRIQYYCPEPGKYTAVSISESKKENE
ncbi:MAG: hypothetical protein V1919_02655 [Candidatus Omnitrophota bacterium]